MSQLQNHFSFCLAVQLEDRFSRIHDILCYVYGAKVSQCGKTLMEAKMPTDGPVWQQD